MDLPAVDPISPEDMPEYLRAVSGYMKKVGLTVPDSIASDTITNIQSND
jgi:hypothetical protein